MSSVPIIVRTCPGREEYARYVTTLLPDALVSMDRAKNAMSNFIQSLKMAGEGAALQLEDDLELTTGFRAKVNSAINCNPGSVIQFFSRKKDDLTVGTRWLTGATFMGALCFYLPPGYSSALVAYYPTWRRRVEHPSGTDLMVADFLKDRKERYLTIVPNLVEHLVGVSSIDSRRSSKRQSLTYVP